MIKQESHVFVLSLINIWMQKSKQQGFHHKSGKCVWPDNIHILYSPAPLPSLKPLTPNTSVTHSCQTYEAKPSLKSTVYWRRWLTLVLLSCQQARAMEARHWMACEKTASVPCDAWAPCHTGQTCRLQKCPHQLLLDCLLKFSHC